MFRIRKAVSRFCGGEISKLAAISHRSFMLGFQKIGGFIYSSGLEEVRRHKPV